MNDYDIWFSLVKLSPKNKLKLINEFHDTKKIWYYSVRNKKSEYFKNDLMEILNNGWNESEIDNVKRNLEINEIKSISFGEAEYPKKLKNYDDVAVDTYTCCVCIGLF